MNKKVSTGFAVIIIVAIAAFFIIMINKNSAQIDNGTAFTNIPKADKAEQDCSKHAYDGSATIRVWASDEEGVVQVVKEDLSKLPSGCTQPKVKLVDASEKIAAQIKKATEKKPAQVTIKGVFVDCSNIPMVSLNSGEAAFKKLLSNS